MLAALSLPACRPAAPELPPAERAAVHAALQGWRAAGLPEPDALRCDFAGARVRVEPLETGCEVPTSSQLHDCCLRWDESGHWFRPLRYPVVVIDPTFPAQYRDGCVVHEILHAAWTCAGLNPMSPDNREHASKQVWTRAYKPGEDASSAAESRANALVTGATPSGTIAP